MIVVIFEVWPFEERKQDYLHLAGLLRDELEQIDGFISVERFESLTENGKLLSLSFWRDEGAVKKWRNNIEHRAAQATARAGIFSEYRLRVAEISRDYGMRERAQAPDDSVINMA